MYNRIICYFIIIIIIFFVNSHSIRVSAEFAAQQLTRLTLPFPQT